MEEKINNDSLIKLFKDSNLGKEDFEILGKFSKGLNFKENDLKFLVEDLNLRGKDLNYVYEVLSFSKKIGCLDSSKNAIKEIKSDSSFFVRFMKRELINKKYGEDFEFAKLMVTKINPNTILAFNLSMIRPTKSLQENNPTKFKEVSERREFFANYFMNDCDLSQAAFPNPKVSLICKMGFLRKEEVEVIMKKRYKELHKFASKNDYNRGQYTLEKY